MQTEHCTETQNFLNVLYILFISQKVNTLSSMPLSNHYIQKAPSKVGCLSKLVCTGLNDSFPTDTKSEWSSVTPYLISHCL